MKNDKLSYTIVLLHGVLQMEHFPHCNYPMSLIGKTYESGNQTSYEECIKELSDWINSDCWGVIVNDTDILFNSYNTNRTFREQIMDNVIRNECATNLHKALLCEINCRRVDAAIDIYMFSADRSPMRVRVSYRAATGTYTTTFFASYVEEREF